MCISVYVRVCVFHSYRSSAGFMFVKPHSRADESDPAPFLFLNLVRCM